MSTDTQIVSFAESFTTASQAARDLAMWQATYTDATQVQADLDMWHSAYMDALLA